MQLGHLSPSLPIPDFSKCINYNQNDGSESNSPITPTGVLSKAFSKTLKVSSPTKDSLARVEKIIHLIRNVSRKFHGLRDEEIDPIAKLIDKKFSIHSFESSFEIVAKEGSVTRTIFLENNLKIAHIFLKTKGGLKRSHGGNKTGTNVLEIQWHTNPDRIALENNFLLVPRDDKQLLAQTFEIEKVIAQKPELQDYVVRNKVFFFYEKKKKITGDIIPKFAGIYPFMPRDLRTHFNSPGIQYHHKTATMLAVATALKILHAAGISHGDIKRANILVGPDGRPKLADFDFSNECETEKRVINTNSYGTLKYTAPEHLVCEDVMTLDLRALDVWAFGCMLQSLCAKQFIELNEIKTAYKATMIQCKQEMDTLKRVEPATDLERRSLASKMKNKREEIHSLQMNNEAAANMVATLITSIMDDEEVPDDQKDKIFLDTLGVMSLHPNVASRPTFEKIVQLMEGTFQIEW